MTLAVGLILIGSILIYAGVTGLSVTRLLLGDNTTPAPKKSIAA